MSCVALWSAGGGGCSSSHGVKTVDVSSESALQAIERFSILIPLFIGGYVRPNRKFVKRDESPQTEENGGATGVGLTGLGRNQHLTACIELIRCSIIWTKRQWWCW